MERKKIDVLISLLGTWEKKKDWKKEFRELLRGEAIKNCEDVFSFYFLETVPLSRAPFLPEVSSRVLSSAFLAQQLLQSSFSDIAIYVNDGAWDKEKYKLLNELKEKSSVLFVWTPTEVEDELPEDDDPTHLPSVLLGKGSLENLVLLVLYVLLPGEEVLL